MAEYQPYVGPSPFERKDRHIFFGRTREANELISLIVSHSEILLYAQSGAGKTSLINAKIIPGLEEERFDVLPLARVQGPIQGADANATKNIYVFHTLMSWAGNEAVPRKLVEVSVADYLGWREHPTDEDGITKPRVVIFDQFEELFTFYPERWPDRKEFFQQVREALDKDPLLRVVFSMREDHVAELHPYINIVPEKFRTRFRLERLREQAALEAVKRPVKDSTRYFAGGAAEALVDDLLKIRAETPEGESVSFKDEFVEPVQLQVVCQSLWQSLSPEIQEITHQRLEECADVDHALSAFYERSIKKAVDRFEASEGVLRRWFEDALITPAGTRGTVFRGRKEAGGLNLDVVNFLEDEHLIRTERRGGASWYELTHDRFIQPIRESNSKWFLRSASEQIRRNLQRRALEWMRLGRERSGLLDQANLIVAQRWLADAAANEPGYRSVLALVEASKAAIEEARLQLQLTAERQHAEEQKRLMEEQAKAARRLRRSVIASLVMVLLAVIFGLFAWYQRDQANTERDRAEAGRLVYEGRVLLQSNLKWPRALENFKKARKIYEETGELKGLATTLNELGKTCANLGDKEEAVGFFDQALQLAKTLPQESDGPTELATILLDYGYFCMGTDKDKAFDLFSQLLKLLESSNHPEDLRIKNAALNSIAEIYHDKGDEPKEEEFKNQAKAIKVKIEEADAK